MTRTSVAPHLIVFAKNPRLGRVKTRLAQSVGEVRALAIYEELILINQDLCQEVQWPKTIYYSDFIDPVDRWEKQAPNKRLQAQMINLGDRMQAAIQTTLFSEHAVLLIGSDCPYIRVEHLMQAADHLSNCDVVIGPALDGGFYLLGMKTWHDGIFDRIEWSTSQVRAQLIANLEQLNLTFDQTEALSDIDVVEDWKSFKKHQIF